MRNRMYRLATILLMTGVLLLQGCASPYSSAGELDEQTYAHEAPDGDAVEYFLAVALSGFEFGSAPSVVYKWTDDILIQVTGSPAESDETALDQVIDDLNDLIAPLQIRRVATGGNVTIFYGPDEEFPRQVRGYTPGNRGYFAVNYSSSHAIRSSKILISTNVTKKARAHLVREELTQSLGMFRDSWDYEDSIFYQGWTTTGTYAPIDETVVRLLYDPRLKPGMTREQVLALLDA
ncbi:MAG TPA: DUF2927 domain-containing protein [Symbiobacteriaceae bacterium]|nr:DUF2927 domain-containing protein [Symbiobacteriaceae bacterium]